MKKGPCSGHGLLLSLTLKQMCYCSYTTQDFYLGHPSLAMVARASLTPEQAAQSQARQPGQVADPERGRKMSPNINGSI